LDTAPPEVGHTAPLYIVSVDGTAGVDGTAAAPEGASRKRKRPKRRREDRRRKAWSKGITARERKDLIGADRFALQQRRWLNTNVDFHPCHLDAYPEADLDVFFQGLRTRISTYCGRKKIGCYWVWTRENYAGDRREHLHMVMHLPPRFRADLEAYIRRIYPGGLQLVQVGERTRVYNPETGRWEDGLAYRMKQLRGDAVGKPGPTRLNRETRSRCDGAAVAPVYGKRCGVSDSLTLKAEQKWRAATTPPATVAAAA
jgi:hypothetical protein